MLTKAHLDSVEFTAYWFFHMELLGYYLNLGSLEYSTTGSVSQLVLNLVGFVVKALQAVSHPSEAIVTARPNKIVFKRSYFFNSSNLITYPINHEQEIV